MIATNPRTGFHAWLSLLRVPNLLTVPGDPLAGAMLAMAERGWNEPIPWAAAAASVVLYAAGLTDNDLADLEEDRRERPGRPLPAGAVSARAAAIARALLLAAGLGLAAVHGMHALLAAAAIGGLMTAYNHGLKRVPLIGPLAMGACRGLSVLLGATAVALPPAGASTTWSGVAAVTIYIAAVAQMARDETRIPGRARLIGTLIGLLPLLQAALVLSALRRAGPWVALGLVACAAASALLRRRFAAS
ncbi:MAG: 4-hydroxybenzoate polyprenyltransferase [Lentisphaerae bacterium]|nr:4-hydroxybenzoate polyprenyltransferase [Lentisphaerota bacterium]